jgi:hypothetical protein
MRGLAAGLVMVATTAVAQPICVKPGVPACMDDGTTFVSAEKMVDCQGAVREYIDRTMEYVQCLNDDVKRTGKELNQNVDRFNCRLGGRKDCQ